MQKLGMEPYRFMSGGFLAFKLSSVSEYFLNYYNEDWIWLFLHKPKAKLVKYGEVYQLPYDPFENAVERALQQEFGEILVEGVKRSIESGNNTLILNKSFWDRIIKIRSDTIERVIHISQKNKFSTGISVGKHLLRYCSQIDGKSITNLFINYFQMKKLWCLLLNLINKKNFKGGWI